MIQKTGADKVEGIAAVVDTRNEKILDDLDEWNIA